MGLLGRLKGAATLAKRIYDYGAAQSAQAQLHDSALQGPAGRHLAGVEEAPDAPRRIEDPAEWERVMRAELAARVAAREPYLAPARSPLRIGRIVTRGATQGREVAEHLAACGLAGRPDLAYGVSRVPDRIRPSAGAEHRRVVEWDIVHAAREPLERAELPANVFVDARTTWVARRIGVRKTTGGDELPCADGKPRVRMHGGDHVVLAYRDSPAYAEGRRRWAAYEAEGLQADLSCDTAPRRPVPAREYGMGKLERGANRVADVASFLDPDTSNDAGPPPPRYCWPPVL